MEASVAGVFCTMSDDDEGRVPVDDMPLGGDLSACSLDELNERITLLEAEIGRIRRIIKEKTVTKSTAEQFFKT